MCGLPSLFARLFTMLGKPASTANTVTEVNVCALLLLRRTHSQTSEKNLYRQLAKYRQREEPAGNASQTRLR